MILETDKECDFIQSIETWETCEAVRTMTTLLFCVRYEALHFSQHERTFRVVFDGQFQADTVDSMYN